jgi:hypothetical protein
MKFWGLFKIENLVINSLNKRERESSAILGWKGWWNVRIFQVPSNC